MKKLLSILIVLLLSLSGPAGKVLPLSEEARTRLRTETARILPAPPADAADAAELPAKTPDPAPAGVGYTVIITDEAGAPVPGVMVRICPGSRCIMRKTDDNGTVLFEDVEPGVHEFHLFRFPEGYVAASGIPDRTGPDERMIRITLKKVD